MAYLYASQAGYAEVCIIFYEGPVPHNRQIAFFYWIIRTIDIQPVRQILNLALSGSRTNWALQWMIHKDQLHYLVPNASQYRGVRPYLHAFCYYCVAGCHGTIYTFYLDHAHPARIRGTDLRMITKSGYPNAGLFRRFQYGHSFRGRNLNTINYDLRHYPTFAP
jgi:hypothetical protein